MREPAVIQRASTTFCWLPPLRCAAGDVGAWRLDPEALDPVIGQAALRGDG